MPRLPSARYHAHRLVFRHLGLPPRTMRPYALPGAAAFYHRRWQRMLARRPVITADEHAAAVGVGPIEEPIGCDLCGERRVQPLFSPRDYHVVRCPACGFLYRNPGIRPERLGDLYAGRYSRFLTGRYAKQRQRRYMRVMDAFAPQFGDGSGRRLLDFGCGAGLFLEVARDRGFEGYGVDLSPDSVERARAKGLRAHFGGPRDVPEIAAGGFDVITMWSVLAHLAEPVSDLTMLRGLLAPGGVLLILTVNANSLLLKAERERWGGFTPNHLKFYAPDTLTALTRRAGFDELTTRPSYGDAIDAGRSTLWRGQERRLRRTVEDGNQGNMLRAVAR